MRICYLTRNFDQRASGGRNPSLRYYARALGERGHEATIISVPWDPTNADRTDGQIHYTGYSARLSYDVNLPLSIPRIYRKVRALHAQRPFDLIHSLDREFAGIAAVWLRRRLQIPFVQWMYDLGYETQSWVLLQTRRGGLLRPFVLRFLKHGERYVLKHADRILAIGQDIIDKSLTPRGYTAPQVVLVNNTVDAELFCRRAPDPALEAEYGIERPLVLMVARIDPVKGIGAFVDIVAAVGRARPDVRFLVIGSDKDGLLPGYLAQAERLGVADRIAWHPERTDVEQLYPLADCVVICTLPSGGGISNVLLESMACARVVLANRCCGVPHVIHDWENGVSVPGNDPEAFAAAIVRVLGDPQLRSTLERNARQTVLDRLSLDRSVALLLETYRDAIESA